MSVSHHRHSEPGAARNRTPDVVARRVAETYSVLHREPQILGDPEHAVCRGIDRGEIVALFFSDEDAQSYCLWKNQPIPTLST